MAITRHAVWSVKMSSRKFRGEGLVRNTIPIDLDALAVPSNCSNTFAELADPAPQELQDSMRLPPAGLAKAPRSSGQCSRLLLVAAAAALSLGPSVNAFAQSAAAVTGKRFVQDRFAIGF